MSSKVLNHPDKEEIIRLLLNGDSVKEVERWLKKKYPKSKRLQISYMTIQKFRSEHLNLKGEILDDIKNKRAEVKKDVEVAETRMMVSASSSYQDKIEEIASSELDVSRRLLELDALIGARIEYYYNLLENGGSIREDKIFIEYINTLKSLMQDWKKYIEGFADKKIEHNINVNVINSQVNALKEVMYEIIQEMSPDLIPIFINKVNKKMTNIEYGSESYNKYIIDAEESF
jgi:hypothetical protein